MRPKFVLFCLALILASLAWIWQWNYYGKHYSALTHNLLIIVKGTYLTACIDASKHYTSPICHGVCSTQPQRQTDRQIVEYCVPQAEAYTADFAKLLEQIDRMVEQMERAANK